MFRSILVLAVASALTAACSRPGAPQSGAADKAPEASAPPAPKPPRPVGPVQSVVDGADPKKTRCSVDAVTLDAQELENSRLRQANAFKPTKHLKTLATLPLPGEAH